jgi:tetratricopeptide (TPR) repeat protein
MSRILAILPLCLLAAAGRLAAAGGEPKAPSAGAPSPEQQAIAHYNEGLAHRDKALDYEKRAAAAEADREQHLKKARQEYGKAIAAQLAATAKNPRFHEAFSSLGYACRKTGDYQGALKAYDTALNLKPDYAEAIEYRGEAYLGLNRIEEAQQAYEWLFLHDPKKAEALLLAFKSWVAAPPAGAGPEKVAGVQAWVGQKETAAQDVSGTKETGKNEW